MRYVFGIIAFLLSATLFAGEVAGRFVFYNFSLTPQADSTIAPNKVALLPGQTASFQNYTSTPSLTGIMVDLTDAKRNLSLADFVFSHGNTSLPNQPVSPPPFFVVRPGAGVDGATRVQFLFPRGVIQREWLRVVVKAGEQTGLSRNDTFYFGNAPGDTGNSASDTIVNELDETAWNEGVSDTAHLDEALLNMDFDKDGNLTIERDLMLIRYESQQRLPPLALITVPVSSNNSRIDPSFGVSGQLLYRSGDPRERRAPIVVLPDGGMLIGSSSGKQDAEGFTLTRFTASGTLMEDWGDNGSVRANFGPTGGMLTHLLYQDDYVYAFGTTTAYGTTSLPIIALTSISLSSGEVQVDFGRDGVAAANIGNQPLHLAAVSTYLHDGQAKLLIAGTATTTRQSAQITLLSFTKQGTIDRDFASVKQELHAIFESGAVPTKIETTPSAIYVMGYGILKHPHRTRGLVILKFSMKGDLQLIYPLAMCPSGDGIRRVLGFQIRDGKVMAGASCEKNFMLVRYNESGEVDSTFGQGGLLLTKLGWQGYSSSAYTMNFDGDSVFIGGKTHDGKLPHMAVTCLNTVSGAPCRTFGNGGLTVFPFLGPLVSIFEVGAGSNFFVGGPTFRAFMDPQRYSRELSIRRVRRN